MYDEKGIKLRVFKKRQFFIVYLAIALAILAGGITLIALNLSDTLLFLGIVIIISSLVFITNLLNKYQPKILFSRAVKGKNIKEDIYEVYVRRGVALRPKQVGMGYGGQPLSHTRMAKLSLRSAVYLKLDNGDIREIRNMRVEHVELYGDGDTLYKHAGAKYPVILGRAVERQPCPLCGTINAVKDDSCITCGLKIIQ